jgi:pimeloyl-ACP methyl ester carboxylesterase
MALQTLNHIRTHYIDQGDRSYPVIVLIHGLGCSTKYWRCVLEASEFSQNRILALDLPGFGMSDKPDTYDYSLQSQADTTYALVQALDIPRFTLIGHSMGGTIAILLAQKYTEHVERLIVIEPNLKASDAHLSREIIRRSEAEFINQYDAFTKIAVDTVQNWFVNSHRVDIEEYIQELLKTTPVSMYRSARSLMAVTANDDFVHQFQHLAMPKHLLIGEETLKTRNLLKNFQDSSVRAGIVPGVGHMMMVDNPLLFNRTLASMVL